MPKVERRIQGKAKVTMKHTWTSMPKVERRIQGRAKVIASLIQIKEWLKSVHFVSRHPALDTPRYLRQRPGYAALPSAFPKVEPRIQGAWPTAHWAAHVND